MDKIWIVICIGSVVVAGMLGLTLGITLNPESSVRYVWDWGIAAGWVSGLGAMAAAIVAVYQSLKNSANEKIRFAVVDLSTHDSWTLRVVSEGLIPATILGAELVLGDSRYRFPMQISEHAKLRFPIKLDRGDVAEFFNVEGNSFRYLGRALLSPLVARLAQEGRHLHGYELDEGYFDALRSYGDRAGIIRFRFAHDDYEHRLSPDLVRALIISHSNKLREETQVEIEVRRKSLARDVAEAQRLIEKGDEGQG